MISLPSLRKSPIRPIVSHCLLLSCLFNSAKAQQTAAPSGQRSDEVVRVFTELVQTDVMVFDKQGKFIKDLKREDFELKIDGRVRPIQSFDQIAAGSDEETQLAAARSNATSNRPVPLDRGRVVFFYVDDFHMDLQGVNAARKTIRTFIDKEMGQNDQAAVTSANQQIGFLQQLTNNRAVLDSALERLSYHSYPVRDSQRPTMSEYQAILIDREDPTAWEYFIVETIRAMGLPDDASNRQLAASIVRSRAHILLEQSAVFNNNTLTGLERLVRGARDVPGRKVVFFLSNGFMIENNRSNTRARLRDVVNSAARSGVVIYSLDTKGLVATLSDISSGDFDRTGRMENATHGELSASQDGLNALAVDTGGRALFNTNDLSKGLKPALKETSVYYLLAWQPENLEGKAGRFRKIEVSVIGKPNLIVRVRRGFYDLPPSVKEQITKKASTDAAKPPAQRLIESIRAAYPKNDLPVTLGINYYDLEAKGSIVAASIQLPGEFLEFGQQNDKIQAAVDLTGVFFNDRGQPKSSFSERIVTTAPSIESTKDFQRDITYTFPARLTPGLYQVRVAARDDKSGRIGSAQGWIKVPDLTDKRLALSSLLLGEYVEKPITNVSSVDPGNQANMSASHRFNRRSRLRLLLFTYNSTPASTDQKPDLGVQVQVIRDDQPVVTTSLRKIGLDGVTDLTRVPYAADVLLDDLLPGRYVLQVSVIDRVSKQSAIQRTHFEVY